MLGGGEVRDSSKLSAGDPHYGTFSQLPPPSEPPSVPLPQPLLPPPPLPQNTYYNHQHHAQPPPFAYHAIPVGYQSLPYTALVEGVLMMEPQLPCCGIGIGWALFLAGFFFAAIPWYVGVYLLVFGTMNYREQAGLVACTVGALLAAIPVFLRVFNASLFW